MARKSSLRHNLGKAYIIGSPAIGDRIAWVDTFLGLIAASRELDDYKFLTASNHVYNDLVHHPTITERGDEIVLFLPMFEGSQRRFVPLRLCRLNPDELENVKKVIDIAFEAARPIVEARLKDAEEASERGENYYMRLYRPDTRLVFGNPKVTPLEEESGGKNAAKDNEGVAQPVQDETKSE